MTVSMITCPACRTMLFSDTIVCPECRHVLDAERAALVGNTDHLAKSRSEQLSCRGCGEANQIGLVRCWNCSAFLREDIQEAYYDMLRSQRETIYSQPGTYLEDEQTQKPSQTEDDSSDDDDFELSGSYSLSSPTPAGSASSETYNLSGSPPAESKSPDAPGTPASSEEPTDAAKPAANPEQEADAKKSEAAKPQRDSDAGDPHAEDHSVATGGDVLLEIALKEEMESEKLREKKKSQAGRKQKPRKRPGKKTAGDDPSPERLAAQKKVLARRKAAQKRAAAKKRESEKKYGLWLSDARQHALNPQKLKLKPGFYEKQFEPVDVGCSADGVIVVSLAKKPGLTLFSKKKATPEELREEVRAHLEAGKTEKELPAPAHEFFAGEALSQFKVVQPVVYIHESLFAGVSVFGEGRVAVMLPGESDAPERRFLSFWLTEFREFSTALAKYLGIKDFGHLEGVPLTDSILDLQCHYSEVPLKAVDPDALTFYEADPAITLELIGRRCAECGLAVSEDARRKEKIGGLNGKSIAKAKCPKCEKKFGDVSLFQLAAEKKTAEDAAAKTK